MAYAIGKDGKVELGARRVGIPSTLSKEAQAYLALLPSPLADSGTEQPMWEHRAAVDALLTEAGDHACQLFGVQVEDVEVGGVPCRLARPRSRDVPSDAVLLNFHGGGFCLGGRSVAEAVPIAGLTGLDVVAVDYRLSPEHRFPAQVDDALAVYLDVLKTRPASNIAVFGTSAGGFLTGQLAARLNAEGLPQPACLGIFTASGDMEDYGDSAQIFTLSGLYGEPVRAFDHPLSERAAYCGGHDPSDPLLSPTRGDVSYFPPTLFVTSTRDALLSGTSLYHRALRRANVEAELYVFEGLPHGFWMRNYDLPETREALSVMAEFFSRHLAKPL